MLSGCETVTAISAIAAAISQGKSINEITMIAAILTQLGDTLATIAAQRAICEENKNNSG